MIENETRKRNVTAADLELIQQVLAREGHFGRTHVSRRLCRLWNFRQANGAFREIACRDLLRQLHRRGFITLPAPLKAARTAGYCNPTALPFALDPSPLEGASIIFPNPLSRS